MAEVLAREYESRGHLAPSQQRLLRLSGFRGIAQLSHLLRRSDGPLPSAEQISNLWVALTRPDAAPETDEAALSADKKRELASGAAQDLLRQAQALVEAQERRPLPYQDGRVESICGAVSPQSFLLEVACNYDQAMLLRQLKIKESVVRRDLLSSRDADAFPFPRNLLDGELWTDFFVCESSLQERLLMRRDRANRPSLSPKFFYMSRSLAARASDRLNIDLLELADWFFLMAPAAALLGKVESPIPLREHESIVGGLLRVHGRSAAIKWLRQFVGSHRVIRVEESVAADVFDAAWTALAAHAMPAISYSVTSSERHALADLNAGNYLERTALLAGAPQCWAVWSQSETALNVVVTEEDILGVPTQVGWQRERAPAAPTLVSDEPIDPPAKIGRGSGRANAEVVVCEAEVGWQDSADLQCAGGLVAALAWRLKLIWSQSEHNKALRTKLLQDLVEGYEARGGAGLPISIAVMEQFVDSFMHLHPGPMPGSNSENSGRHFRPLLRP